MPHSPIHTLKAHFPQCFDKNGDLMPHKLQEAILDLAQESTTQQRAEQKGNAKDKAQSDIATDFQEKDAILSLSKETYTLNWLGILCETFTTFAYKYAYRARFSAQCKGRAQEL